MDLQSLHRKSPSASVPKSNGYALGSFSSIAGFTMVKFVVVVSEVDVLHLIVWLRCRWGHNMTEKILFHENISLERDGPVIMLCGHQYGRMDLC